MAVYYYINSQGQQMPPVDIETLRNIGITPDTMVWCEGMPQWMRAGDVPELQSMLFVESQPSNPFGFNQSSSPYNGPSQGYGQQGYYNPNFGQQGYGYQNQVQKPQNWLWLGICVTILCCLPFGIVSIVYGARVDSLWAQGNYQEAINSSKYAKLWGIAGACTSLIAYIFYFALYGVLMFKIFS